MEHSTTVHNLFLQVIAQTKHLLMMCVCFEDTHIAQKALLNFHSLHAQTKTEPTHMHLANTVIQIPETRISQLMYLQG